MNKYRKYLLLCIVFLGISILFNGLMIGYSIQSYIQVKKLEAQEKDSSNGDIFTLEQAAQYLHMSEMEVLEIISTEKKQLELVGVFTGKMFPYVHVNGKYHFYKGSIDEWLMEATASRRQYNASTGWVR